MRVQARITSPGAETTPFRTEELLEANNTIALGKAPGVDGIGPEIVRYVVRRYPTTMLRLYEEYRRARIFPTEWKVGKAVLIPKGGDKDPRQAKSYRPITLLPVLGKLYEKLINKRLTEYLRESGGLSDRQYGFREGVGTMDALLELKDTVTGSPKTYVIGLFLDIAGAFDNAWWPGILCRLGEIRCPADIHAILQDYF